MGRIKTGKIIKCKICKAEFYVSKSLLKKKKYCSILCFKKDTIPWNKGLTKYNDNRLATISKKSTEQMHREYANGTRDKQKIVKKAHETVRIKSNERFKTNPNIRIGKRGYVLIYIPLKGWKKYHHYIWEKYNGIIPIGYDIHHIDEDKLNNNIDNLQMLLKTQHHKLHYQKNLLFQSKGRTNYQNMKRDKFGRFIAK